MNIEERIQNVISPERCFPTDIQLGKLRSNQAFIESLSYIELLRESQYWSAEVIERIRVERLKKLLRSISETSEFWANHFNRYGLNLNAIHSTDVIRRLPVMRRKTIVGLGEKIYVLNQETERRQMFTRYTSGTGGLPMKLMFDQMQVIVSALIYRFRHPAFDKISLSELLQRKFFVALALPGDRHVFDPDFTSYTFHPLSPYDLQRPSVRRQIYDKIVEAGPALLAGYASLIKTFAQLAAEDNVTLPLLAVRLASDGITKDDRIFVERTLNAPVLNLLSSNGASLIGFECPENMGFFHLNAERLLLEILDDEGNPVPPGEEGELVVTALDHTVTPIIRYGILDTGRLIPEKCPCGRTLPLFEFYGRRGHEVKLPSGKAVKVIYIHNELQFRLDLRLKVLQFQIRQESLNKLRLLMNPRIPFTAKDESNIRQTLRDLLYGERIDVDLEYVDHIPPSPGGKPRMFVPLGEN